MSRNVTKLASRNIYQVLKSWYPSGPKKTPDNARRTSTTSIAITTTQDLVGPPDPLSNIRPITFHIPEAESGLEKKYRLRRMAVQAWHQSFWAHHNAAFVKERKEFEKSRTSPMTSDEMSVFYKKFLDKYWVTHLQYARKWYIHNFELLGLAAQVQLRRILSPLLK
ncbi:hypothetical protein GE061_018078 [Apolygus lucorum]|uniref:APOPT family protein CG14806, mitochondrial n=1 Tax=Apolygus lucorum TaxID=248454 RepID=A0A8S9XCT6_APOLU|nr:hypothetical protein GE061_018078 [Apolygus lucorum]